MKRPNFGLAGAQWLCPGGTKADCSAGGSLAPQGSSERKEGISGVLLLIPLRSPRWSLFSTCRHRELQTSQKSTLWGGFAARFLP